MGLDSSQMYEESDMAESFKVGDSFVFNGQPADWWQDRGIGDWSPWSKIKKGSILSINRIDIANNSYIASNGLHFYFNQMDLPFRIKLRRKSA